MGLDQKKNKKEESKSPLVLGMAGCYAMGTFADNFYKQCAVLLAAAMAYTDMQSLATVLFSLPFVMCSAWAGWLSDRAPKKYIVMGAKITELLSLGFGAYFLAIAWWPGILAVIFFMGMQSTAFSPALNGSIPEYFTVNEVPRINSYIKLATTISVLAGVAMAGYFLDLRPGFLPSFGIEDGAEYGRALAGVFVIMISFLGFLTAFTLKKRAPRPEARNNPFPWSGPKASMQQFWAYRKDPQFFIILLAEGMFYAIAAIAVICIANLANELGYSATMASLLSACIMVGIAVGAVIAGRFDAYSWRRFLVPASITMGLFLVLISFAPKITPEPFLFIPDRQMAWFLVSLFFAGIYGGIYLIPVASFIQVHPPASEKGKALGVSNFASFVAIAISGVIFYFVGKLPASWTFMIYGLTMICFGLFFLLPAIRIFCAKTLRDSSNSIFGDFIKAILSVRYGIYEQGLDDIRPPVSKDRQRESILFLPNHPAMIDPFIVYSRIAGLRPRAMVDSRQVTGIKKLFAYLFRMILIPDVKKDGRVSVEAVRAGLDDVVKALKKGESIILYPSGKLAMERQELVGANSAVDYILKAIPDQRVVLVRTKGLWGSSFSKACGHKPKFLTNIFKKAFASIFSGIFFVPKRGVSVEFIEPDNLPRNTDKKTLNTFLEDFYSLASHQAFQLPLYFWQGYRPRILPCEMNLKSRSKALAGIDQELRRRIFTLIGQLSKTKLEINDDTRLGADLGIDSLDVMEIAAVLEVEYGCYIFSYDGIVTAGDCLLAATGQLADGQATAFMPPMEWFCPDTLAAGEQIVYILPEENIVSAFLRWTKEDPHRLLMAEGARVLSSREILAGALLMSARFSQLKEERIGVLLPSSIASSMVWLALQMAGKVPVHLNWTQGSRNLESCIETAGLAKIVVSTKVWDQIENQSGDYSHIRNKLIFLERAMGLAPRREKIRAMLKARFFCLTGAGLRQNLNKIPETAVILFTSGSESTPKAVPLTHKNIMNSMRGLVEMLEFKSRQKILSILPPFHSFGFLSGIAMPLSAGLSTVFHPNPLEGHKLAGLIHHYGVTMLGTIPSFLAPILKFEQDTLASLRLVFMGGEFCPEALREKFAQRCPKAFLCEGYGLTECSPAVSVNPPSKIKKGTMGIPLPGVEVAIVKKDGDAFTRASANEKGHLLIKGDNVFSGYLNIDEEGQPFVEFEGEKWFKTQDLAFLDEDEYLTIVGRSGRFAKLGGEMISLQLMEDVLVEALKKNNPDWDKNFLALIPAPGTEERGLSRVLALSTKNLDVKELNQMLLFAGLSPIHCLSQCIQLRELPLLSSGKIDYHRLPEMIVPEDKMQ